LELPFEIVDRIEFEYQVAVNPWAVNHHHLATVYLGDSSVLKGYTWGYFEGSQAFGKVGFRLDEAIDQGKGLKSLKFHHQAQASHQYAGWGKHRVKVHLLDDREVMIDHAAFVGCVMNENGCRIREEPSDILDFEQNETQIEVEWKKLAAILLKDREATGDYRKVLELKAVDGSSLTGFSPAVVGFNGAISGALVFNANYTLRAELELCHFFKPLVKSVDFVSNPQVP
jgi:hypothetical protein